MMNDDAMLACSHCHREGRVRDEREPGEWPPWVGKRPVFKTNQRKKNKNVRHEQTNEGGGALVFGCAGEGERDTMCVCACVWSLKAGGREG